MISTSEIKQAIPNAVEKTDLSVLTGNGYEKHSGKVRDMYVNEDKNTAVMVTTDRISAFDRVVGAFPFKGAVLTRLAKHGFRNTSDIIDNHMRSVVDPQIMVAEQCEGTVPLEVIVRGYLTGSGWRAWNSRPYVLNDEGSIIRDKNGKPIENKQEEWSPKNNAFVQGYGISLTPDMFENGVANFDQGIIYQGAKLKNPIVTPTTKAEDHDQPLKEIQAQQIAGKKIYDIIKSASLELYKRGAKLAAERGLIFVDTKYEFGFDEEGNIRLIDEVNTPDSSRYWKREGYKGRLRNAEKQRGLDKEFTRQFLANESGFRGGGEIPELPVEHIVESTRNYLELFRTVTGNSLPNLYLDNPTHRMERNLEDAINEGIIPT